MILGFPELSGFLSYSSQTFVDVEQNRDEIPPEEEFQILWQMVLLDYDQVKESKTIGG